MEAPVTGTVRVIGAIYRGDDPDLEGVEVSGDAASVKIFYVEPTVETGDQVEIGTQIGTVQDVAGEYPNSGMQNHVHVEVKIDGQRVDPATVMEREERE